MSALLRLAFMAWANAGLVSRLSGMVERYAKAAALFVVALVLAVLMLAFAGMGLGLWLGPKIGGIAAALVVAAVFLVLAVVAAIAGRIIMKPSGDRPGQGNVPIGLPSVLQSDAIPRVQSFARSHTTELVLGAIIAGMLLAQKNRSRG